MAADAADERAARVAAVLGDELAWPSAGGEPVFAEPWQGRAFGLALDLVERSGWGWEPFRQQLIAAVAADPQRPYFESWVIAVETFALDAALVRQTELDHERTDAAAYRTSSAHSTEVEVFPVARPAAEIAAVIGDILHTRRVEALGDPTAWGQIELYRVRSAGDEAPRRGLRAFDRDGVLIADLALTATDADRRTWNELGHRLLGLALDDDGDADGAAVHHR
jgi:hypothetical protein